MVAAATMGRGRARRRHDCVCVCVCVLVEGGVLSGCFGPTPGGPTRRCVKKGHEMGWMVFHVPAAASFTHSHAHVHAHAHTLALLSHDGGRAARGDAEPPACNTAPPLSRSLARLTLRPHPLPTHKKKKENKGPRSPHHHEPHQPPHSHSHMLTPARPSPCAKCSGRNTRPPFRIAPAPCTGRRWCRTRRRRPRSRPSPAKWPARAPGGRWRRGARP